MKKTVALLLAFIIAFGCFEMMGIQVSAEDSSGEESVYFGVYYQKKVTELATLRKLRKAQFDTNNRTVVEGIKYIRSGSYYYEATPIEWLNVGEENGCYILMSKDVLAFLGSEGSDFYSGGSLRKWLNTTFLDIAFNDEEKADIGKGFVNYESEYPLAQLTSNPYDVHMSGDLEPVVMDDYVSIPTKEDIESGFQLEDVRAFASEYADANKGIAEYWLRGPARWDYGNAFWYYVTKSGTIGTRQGTWGKGIRPVVKVKKNSKFMIKGKSETLHELNLNQFTFNAYDKDSFVDVSTANADADFDLNHRVTDFKLECYKECFESEGNVVQVPYSYVGNSPIRITADAYREFLIPLEVAENFRGRIDTFTAYMVRDKKDKKPYISSVFGKSADGDEAFCEMQTSTLMNVEEDTKSRIIISAVGAQKGAKYYLAQDYAHVFEESDPVFEVDLTKKFDEGKDIYAYFINPDKTRSDPVKISIDMKRYTETAQKLMKLKSFNLFGNSGQSIALNDDSPLLKGVNLGMDAFSYPIGVDYDLTSNTLKLSLGLNLFQYSNPQERLLGKKSWTSTKEKKDRWSIFKNEVKTLKDTLDDQEKTRKKFNDLKDRYNARKSNPKSISADTLQQKSFSFNTSFIGYLEFQFLETKDKNGKTYWDAYLVDGDAAFSLGLKVSRSFQTFAGPGFPTYGYVEFGFDTKVGYKILDIAPGLDFPVKTGWYVGVEPKAKVGYGAGFKDYFSAGVYGSVTIPLMLDGLENRMTVKLKGSLGFEGEAFVLNFDWPIFEGEAVLYDEYMGGSKKSGVKQADRVGADGDLSAVAAQPAVDRDYLQATSGWLPKTADDDRVSAAADGIASVQTLKQSVYPNSGAKLVRFGDRLMAVWLDDDATRGSADKTRLVYSVCNSATLQWSTPKAVDDNGRMDFYPSVLSDGTNVYLTWQNSNTVFSGKSAGVEDVMNSFDIKAAKYNASGDKFETVTVAQNATYDYNQTVVLEKGKPVVYWTHNDNQTFDGSGYSIMKYAFDTHSSSVVFSDLHNIASLAAIGGKVAYLMDSDGNINDMSDLYLYVDGSRVTTDEIADQPVTYLTSAKLGGNDVFIASVPAGTFTVNGDQIESFTTNTLLVDGNLNVLDCNGTTRLVWTGTKGDENAVFSAEYGENGIGEPVVLATSKNALSNLSAVYGNNVLYAVYNSREYDSEKERYGNADFNSLTARDFTDVSVDLPYFSESGLERGQTSNLDVEVINNGTNRVQKVDVKISDGIGKQTVSSYQVNIAAGDSAIVSVPYAVPELTAPTDLKVEASVDGDVNVADNSMTVNIGKPDMMFRQMTVTEIGDYYVVSCPFWNCGLTDAEDVQLVLSCGDKTLKTALAGTVPASAHLTNDFILSKRQVSFADGQAELKLSAESSSEEASVDNNAQTYILTEKSKSETIFFKDNAGYDDVYIYCRNDNSDENAAWPGEKMTYLYEEDGCGVYAYTPQKTYENIIISNGSDAKKTVEIKRGDYQGNMFTVTNPNESVPHKVISSDYSSIPDDIINLSGSDLPYHSEVLGDANNDGQLNIRDVTCIQFHAAGLRELTGKPLELADYDRNGIVDIADATAVQKAILLM